MLFILLTQDKIYFRFLNLVFASITDLRLVRKAIAKTG